MNNYNLIQRVLHSFALSSQFMREVTFDFEGSYLSSCDQNDNHVFITGLARSGTTILLNALYKSDVFASLSYADMPFVLAPNFWSKISLNERNLYISERAHRDSINVSTKSPEAFEEVFWKTFDENEDESIEKFKIYVENIRHKYKRDRYLSKNNQNIKRLQLISEIYPKAKIFVIFRNPIQQAYSLFTQHMKFIEDSKNDGFISKYMYLIGHTEFGPNYIPISNNKLNFKNHFDINHWIEQWCLTYKKSFKSFNNKYNVYFLSYERICTSKEYWYKILRILEIDELYDFGFMSSTRDITLDININLRDEALSLYDQLYSLSL